MKDKKRLTFFSQYFYPLTNPVSRRILAFGSIFLSKGWEVKVVTGMPNYPKGKFLKGYKRFFKYEKVKGFKTYRFFEIPARMGGGIMSALNYISFSFSSLFSFMIIARSEVVYISMPPFPSGVTGFLLAKLFNKKVFLEVRDFWPDAGVSLGVIKKNSLPYKIMDYFNKLMFTNSKLVFTVSEPLKKEIQKRYRVKNVHVATNFSEEKKESKKKAHKKIKIVCLSNLSKLYNLIDYLKTNKDKIIQDKFEWHIVGDGELKSEIEKMIKKNKWKNIFLYGWLTKEKYEKILLDSDIGLIPQADMPLTKMAFPAKTFEYMSYNLPLLTNSSIALHNIINSNDCGWFVNSPSVNSILKLLNKINFKDIIYKSKNIKNLFNKSYSQKIVSNNVYNLILKNTR